jgi:tetratricopeptide (TPR) repeat protein
MSEGNRLGIKHYKKYETEITNSLESFINELTAKNYFHTFSMGVRHHKNKAESYAIYLKEAIATLEESYQTSGSSQVGYYLYYLKSFYHQIEKNYEASYDAIVLLENLIKTKPALNSKTQLTSTLGQVAFISLLAGKYEEAVNYSQKALAEHKKGTMNELATLEVLFLGYFYTHRFIKARETIDISSTHPLINRNEVLPAKWHFYHACLMFKLEDYTGSMQLLSLKSFLSTDKNGCTWELNYWRFTIY